MIVPCDLIESRRKLACDIAYPPPPAVEMFQSEWFQRWFIALSTILEHPLSTYTRERLNAGMTDQNVAERLAPVLSISMPDRKELIDRAWLTLGQLLSLDANETAFLEAVQRGELKPELLFPDNQEEAGRLTAHPAILWKIQNVQSYLARPVAHRKGSDPAKRRK